MESWYWLLGFFAIMMIARVVPRIIRQRKMNLEKSDGSFTERPFFNESKDRPIVKKVLDQSFSSEPKPESKDMLVLGQIIRGYKTFGELRKKTGFDSEELNSILEDLEKRDLMRVEQKKGMIGIKVDLFPTEQGYRVYDS